MIEFIRYEYMFTNNYAHHHCTEFQAKIGSLKTRLIISPVLGVLIGVGGAIILVSITLFTIMCCRVKYVNDDDDDDDDDNNDDPQV